MARAAAASAWWDLAAGAGVVASRPFADDRVALVVYAPSIHARRLKCEAAIESIRSQGLWAGKVYLLTEQVKCYQHERWGHCGLEADVVALSDPLRHTPARRWGTYGRFWEAAKQKLVRSQLWELLQPPPQVQALVYFHGCDFLVGAPLKPFLESSLAHFHAAPIVSFPDVSAATDTQQPQPGEAGDVEGGGPADNLLSGLMLPAEMWSRALGAAGSAGWHERARHRPYLVLAPPPPRPPASPFKHETRPVAAQHLAAVQGLDSGLTPWVIHRTASAALLSAWQQEVKAAPDASEGQLLIRALEHAGRGTCVTPGECMARHVAVDTRWSRQLECDDDGNEGGCGAGQAPAVVNLLPPSVCMRYDHDLVSAWVDQLDLCVYQGDVGFCPPPLMTPFALAWLPYPQCAKLELGLSRLSCQWACTETTFIRSASSRTTITHRDLPLAP